MSEIRLLGLVNYDKRLSCFGNPVQKYNKKSSQAKLDCIRALGGTKGVIKRHRWLVVAALRGTHLLFLALRKLRMLYGSLPKRSSTMS